MTIDRTPNLGPTAPAPVAPPVGAPQPPAPVAPQPPAPAPAAADAVAVGAAARASGAKAVFEETFGSTPYVKDGSDPMLLTLVGALVDRTPQLANTPLAQHVHGGHLSAEDIKQVQTFLIAQGHPCGPTGVDGKYGPNTHAALLAMVMPGTGPKPAPNPGPTPAPQPAPAQQPVPLPQPGPAAQTVPGPAPTPQQGVQPNQGPFDTGNMYLDGQTTQGPFNTGSMYLDGPVSHPEVLAPNVGPMYQNVPAPKPGPAPAPQPGPGPAPTPAATMAAIPPRPADAEGGQAFLNRTANMSRADREEAIFQEIARGNVPDFLRQLKDVQTSVRLADGRTVTATYHVMPDYLAIGSNHDFVRIPMDPMTAQRLAERFGASLPTKHMVDQVYQQATVKLPPSPLPAGPQMMSNDYYRRHEEAVERQRQGLEAPLGELTAGDKKDVIISNAIAQHPGKVIIYGWHQPNGKPIQPLSWIHENTYADYSHGIRLVAGTMTVDGREMPVADVLADPQLSRLLSDEGPIARPAYPTR